MLQVKTCTLAATAERLAHTGCLHTRLHHQTYFQLISQQECWYQVGVGLTDDNNGLKGSNSYSVRKCDLKYTLSDFSRLKEGFTVLLY